MATSDYFGSYARFETVSKKEAAVLVGADNLVGDVYGIVFLVEEGVKIAWLKNRFDKFVGHFDAEVSRRLSLCEAHDMELNAVLSFVAYTESPEPGHYWGEMALVCYTRKNKDAFDAFVRNLAVRIGNGVRPDVDLGEQGVSQVIESGGEWTPAKLIPLPKRSAGTAMIKSRRSASERMIEQARKGNKGCYVLSWAMILAAVAAAIFGLKACGVF